MGISLTFFNCKGGVGKTTTAVNIAVALAMRGSKILLVDLDPHAHSSFIFLSYGVITHTHIRGKRPSFLEDGISALLYGINRYDQIICNSSIRHLDFIPASSSLHNFEIDFISKPDAVFILKDSITAAKKRYDYIIFDPPPGMGLLSISSIVAADKLIVPVQMHFYSMYSLVDTLQLLNNINGLLNIDVELSGIVPTFIDERVVAQKGRFSEIIDALGCSVLMPGIRFDQNLAEAPSVGKTIFDYADKSKGAFDYARLADIIHRRINGERENNTRQTGADHFKRPAFL